MSKNGFGIAGADDICNPGKVPAAQSKLKVF